MGKASKKGSWTILKDGFSTLKLLDNTNVYGVIASECVSNIFKEGMWQKVLGPYTLFLSNHDKLLVGNTITLNSTTRAVVGVVAGRWLINRLGVDTCLGITGVIGLVGIIVNMFCLVQGSISAVVTLNAVWGVYTGLWNACIEVEWAHSLLSNYREDATATRQVLNKLTTAAGPLCSLVIFMTCGNTWTLNLIVSVMLTGTTFTLFVVMLCFRFDRMHEIRQEIYLCDVRMIQFSSTLLVPRELRRASFVPMEDGPIRLSYPLKVTSKYEKLRIFTPDLRETNFILGKQFRAWFKDVPNLEPLGIVYFWDPSREPVRADLESYSVFLRKDGSLNTEFSQLTLHLSPDLRSKPYRVSDVFRRLLVGSRRNLSDLEARELGQSLLDVESRESPSSRAQDGAENRKAKLKEKKVFEPNITKANMLVCCDVLNAVGSGMSLKFIDLFLIEECLFSPAGVLMVAIIQNIFSATLTPFAKQTMNWVRDHGFKSAFGVVVIWAFGCFFMALICIPWVPTPVVVVSIVMMNSLFSCTKAYNRARLINALPHHRVANYMVWDSLNKANQGGVALFGAQLIAYGGYRICFLATFLIFCLRWLIYTGYSLKKGVRRKKAAVPSEGDPVELGAAMQVSISPAEHDDEDYSEAHLDEGSLGHGPDAADSELFPPRVEDLPENELLVVDEDLGHRDPHTESDGSFVF